LKLQEIAEYPFNRVEVTWHGPFPWLKGVSSPNAGGELMLKPGLYRAETLGRKRKIIKYIGSASGSFSSRLTSQHRIKTELVDGAFRRVNIFLGVIEPVKAIRLIRAHYVELEYILQNVHYEDLISWHGLGRLPRTSRGQGWHIINKGERGGLSRVIAYPAFAISGQDRG
jgi:hypothetical protein